MVNYVSLVSQSKQKQETDRKNMKLASPSVRFCSETITQWQLFLGSLKKAHLRSIPKSV